MKINKHKILGYGILVLILAAIVTVTLNYQMSRQPAPNGPSTDAEKNLTYSNSKYGFSFQYPKGDQILEEPQENPGSSMWMRGGVQLVRIDIPKSEYPQTNLSESWAAFSVGQNMNLADCGKYIGGADAQVALDKKETVAGIEFMKAEFAGAGAGNLYETRLYRIYKNNICYEIGLNIHTTNIGNYDPSQGIKAVDKNALWNKLSAILNSYKLATPDVSGAFCGGIAAIRCPDGYVCQYEATYPDAGGKCVSKK